MINKINVAVTCIGSGVAQSVLNSCRTSKLPLKTFGFGNNPMAYGSFDSDVRDFVPAIYANNYPEKLLQKCREHDIDILIPSLDYEVMVLAKNKQLFENEGIRLIISSTEITALCNDKRKLSNSFGSLNRLFCRSFTKAECREAIEKKDVSFPLIAKPNSGFASRGVKILNNKEQLKLLGNDCIIQEMALPKSEDPDYENIMDQIRQGINPQLSEISLQVVIDTDGKIAGKMVSRNKLQNGIPIEIIPFHSISLWEEVDLLINEFIRRGHRGPLNIQGRSTPDGFKIFETNARFTGLTYMRAMMGFNEVEACIKSFGRLTYPPTPLHLNSRRFSMRQTADKIVHFNREDRIKKIHTHLSHMHTLSEKHILVSGAGGYLGRNLISKLAENSGFKIFALSSDKLKIESFFKGLAVKCYSIKEYEEGAFSMGDFDTLIHCAFARPHCTDAQIADSLQYSSRLFMDAARYQLPEIINISSQSVYGFSGENKNEQHAVEPATIYGQAKYAAELMLKNVKQISNHTHCTSLRLSSLSGGQPGFVDTDILAKFVMNVLQGKNIIIKSTGIKIARLDIRDAVCAILELLKIDSSYWQDTYNVGSDEIHKIHFLAEKVNEIVSEEMNLPAVSVDLQDEHIKFRQGIDSNLFKKDTGWKPAFNIEDTILSIVNFYKEKTTV